MTDLANTGKTSTQIRQEFMDFFAGKDHTIVPSASLMPYNDPTLLFTNAGMNQFKDVFLGAGSRGYTRAADTQKCIRAGGKHNDLEDVGRDTYHHTFFEMLGNWSFGDYFKAEAITWAWELMTKVWGLPRERLYATVFGGDAADGLEADEEAAELWASCTDIDPSHILRFGRKDNFWEMGDTGPCGPCTEIHIDRTPDLSGGKLVNADDARVIELWNLVFIQFNRGSDGKLTPLPAKHVDTGMGFERICSVLQGADSNYDTDIFGDLFAAISDITGARAYGGVLEDPTDIAYRVVADHIRTLTFAITDGILPSNEGRGYVLRRILRRAARYGRQNLGVSGGGFLYKLVDTVVKQMGSAFSELGENSARVVEVIREEEESFNRTLDRGIALFDSEVEKLGNSNKVLSGDIAFELYATYGFPPDLTALMARERGLRMDQDGYDKAMEAHKLTSAGGDGKFKAVHVAGLPAVDDSAKYNASVDIEAKVLGWIDGDKFIGDGSISASDKDLSLITDKTNFYGESGGQLGDSGEIRCGDAVFTVSDTQVSGDSVMHAGRLTAGTIKVGDTATLSVSPVRMDTMRNHTATHLLNWALRKVLGEHVDQKGSEVGPQRLRFDFSNPKAVTADQLSEIERLVNDFILADKPVGVNLMPLAEAMELPGVRAVFGEKYPDPVRVISAGTADPRVCAGDDCSVEFCGGSHLDRTGVIGLFKIVGEESISKGVRRITAVTGRQAVETVLDIAAKAGEVAAAVKVPLDQAAERITAMQKDIKALKKKLASGGGASGGAAVDSLVSQAVDAGGVKLLVASIDDAGAGQLRGMVDQLRQKLKGDSAILLGSADDGKVALVAAVSDAVISGKSLKAGDWVKNVATVVGGGGGGKPQMATAGGKQPEKLPEAIEAAKTFAMKALS